MRKFIFTKYFIALRNLLKNELFRLDIIDLLEKNMKIELNFDKDHEYYSVVAFSHGEIDLVCASFYTIDDARTYLRLDNKCNNVFTTCGIVKHTGKLYERTPITEVEITDLYGAINMSMLKEYYGTHN